MRERAADYSGFNLLLGYTGIVSTLSSLRLMAAAAQNMKKIAIQPFRVLPDQKVRLDQWPTAVKPIYDDAAHYQALLQTHVSKLSRLQSLLYARDREACRSEANAYMRGRLLAEDTRRDVMRGAMRGEFRDAPLVRGIAHNVTSLGYTIAPRNGGMAQWCNHMGRACSRDLARGFAPPSHGRMVIRHARFSPRSRRTSREC